MNEPLRCSLYDDAVVCPIQKHKTTDCRQYLGVFDRFGRLLPDTIADRNHGTYLYRAADLPPPAAIADAPEGEAIYAGVFFHHFGHFLIESMARLWYAKDRPDLPVVWIGVDSWPHQPTIRQWQRDMLDILGIRNPLRVLIAPERFKQLHVPGPGYRYADWCHPQQAAFLAAYDGPPQEPGRRLWLSRNGVHNDVGLANSDIVERRLADDGWIVARPETFPLREQLDMLSRAETIAGEEGSAFHSLLLLRNITGKKFRIFQRTERLHQSFDTIGGARQVDQVSFHTRADRVAKKKGRSVCRIAPNADEYLNALAVPVPPVKPPSPPAQQMAERLDWLAGFNKAASYLELSAEGRDIMATGVPDKVSVSPHFPFDTRSSVVPAARFYEMNLSDYAAHFAAGRRFDLIFIRQTQRFEDVLRLFLGSQPLARESAIWVVDGVWPVDECATMASQQDALRCRQATGSARQIWQGDACKFVVMLHDFFPAFRFHTLDDGGRRDQLIVWKEPRLFARPAMGNMAGIAAMIYAQTRQMRDLFSRQSADTIAADLTRRFAAG
ncbi:MAG: glycosyltransferase 61 family protein [Paracoccus sp. (in: a-proteobacteria)]|uniref:glycosyltransferase 61 family protein n=1 Tax=Paracoccus sp. TaxID=267 RepID=UPI0026DF58BB|nr:glycosyltransferase 61 family protein [Paracoccus sp. (in: a-proteobacteria)]MDO5613791.1 glycosyltransferase 61 family protein [Paracoccus sp. (in: a-proteobacteria)]